MAGYLLVPLCGGVLAGTVPLCGGVLAGTVPLCGGVLAGTVPLCGGVLVGTVPLCGGVLAGATVWRGTCWCHCVAGYLLVYVEMYLSCMVKG